MSEPLTLKPMERRILGVLIEKALTTATQYPLSLNAVVTGCNQKSNRDPLVNYGEEQVYDCLERLRSAGHVSIVHPSGSRVEKYRQELTADLDLTSPQKGIIGELLLRGPQTVGDLRGRASRMVRIPDMTALEETLGELTAREHPLVVLLTGPDVKRGVRVTHNLYPAEELEKVLETEKTLAATPSAPRRAPAVASAPDLSALVAEVADLRRRVEILEARHSE